MAEHRIIVVNYYGDELDKPATDELLTMLALNLPINGGTISIAQLNSKEINALADRNVIPNCGEETIKHAIVLLKKAYESNDNLDFSLNLINKYQTDLKTRNAIEILATSDVSNQTLADHGLSQNFINIIKTIKKHV